VGACARIAFGFLAATAAAHACFLEGTADLMGFDTLVNVDAEGNLPTWFASFLLQAAAVIAVAIGQSDDRPLRFGWYGMACVLLLMGIDEVASIHNMPSRRLAEVTGLHGGWLMNAWVLPALLLAAVVGMSFLKFALRLPRWLSLGLVAAGALFLTGSIVCEVISSRLEYIAGGLLYDGRVYYALEFELMAVAEEAFEYADILLTIALLIRRARELKATLSLKL
jgi:hypothetical protein